jgi:tetratricopeptide (TPR) repeat protein
MRASLEENESIYEQGMNHYHAKEWEKAYDCFKTVEMNILNGIGEELKNLGRFESAEQYFHRAQKAKRKNLRLAPQKSFFLQNLLIITGAIAGVFAILSALVFPSILFLFMLIILLMDLLVFIIILPFAIAKWATSRRGTPASILQQITLIENQINQEANTLDLSEMQGFLKRENLKRKRVQLAQKLVVYEHTDAQLGG